MVRCKYSKLKGIPAEAPGLASFVEQIAEAGSAATWGGITGTLSNQSDLQTVLDGKAPSTHNHDAAYAAVGHNHDGAYAPLAQAVPSGGTTGQALKKASNTNFDLSWGDSGGDGGNPLDAWPVGSVFLSVVNTSPATLLGGGTWSRIAEGRMLVGLSSGDSDFDAAEKTGGAKTSSAVVNHTHNITITDPGHSHDKTASNTAATSGTSMTRGSGTQSTQSVNSATTGITASSSNPAGGVSSFSLMNPFFVVYVWKRTA